MTNASQCVAGEAERLDRLRHRNIVFDRPDRGVSPCERRGRLTGGQSARVVAPLSNHVPPMDNG